MGEVWFIEKLCVMARGAIGWQSYPSAYAVDSPPGDGSTCHNTQSLLYQTLIQCVSLPPPFRTPPQATSQTMLRKKTVDLTGTRRLLRTLTAVATTCKGELLLLDSPC
jgi:hypothetical protein